MTDTQTESPAETLSDALAIIHLMIKDALSEHKISLIDQPDVFNHLQMADKHLYNAVLEDIRFREPVPEIKPDDLPALTSQLSPGERFLLRTMSKTPNGLNKNMLGNENQRLVDWGLIELKGNLLTLTERGTKVNHLLSLKPGQRHLAEPQPLAG